MKRIIPRILLTSAFVLMFTSITEPLLSLASTPISHEVEQEGFEEVFFDDEISDVIEELTLEEFEKMTDEELEELGFITELNTFNEDVLADDFDFEAAIDNMDLSKMSPKEEEFALLVIEQEANLSGAEDPELMEDALIDFYDGDSENYNDLDAVEEELIENYIEKIESEEVAWLSKAKNIIFGSDKVYAAKKKKAKYALGRKFVGAIINTAIAIGLGGGTYAVVQLIKKKGKKAAAQAITRLAEHRIKRLSKRNQRIVGSLGHAVNFAIAYSDIGNAITRYIDSRDKYPNNGWLDGW
ncbi:hypothetical protein ACFSKI_07090 [Pseudogracilibacillus auburnensis]|uniref:Uncharacterized protein n=1 Tax=Pseudogracilibacillus auburnensis TaxID=1494959 RepID=A0A2V3VPV5_9BACI|nr:hypothetical protein [Pseudogracilibacillus auburnensis]PXW83570.1 hypothetical protein DFR56_11538 [Pseudogracilibacillus auburnensis]